MDVVLIEAQDSVEYLVDLSFFYPTEGDHLVMGEAFCLHAICDGCVA